MVSIPTCIDEEGDKFIGIIYPSTSHKMVVTSEGTYERALQVRLKVLQLSEEEE